jgi:F-type H+-transporting ATPase subunit b
MRGPLLILGVCLAVASSATRGLAATPSPEPAPAHGAPAAREHGIPPASHQGDPGATQHGAGAHESEAHHAPTVHDINWWHGMIGEKEGVEPDLWWRKKGEPPPLGALLINTTIVYWILYRFGKKPLREALARRKSNLLRGIEEASALRDEARRRLTEYEDKLARIDQELERASAEMREAAEAERSRVLAEARAKGERLEREARATIELELKQARDELLAESVHRAVADARRLIEREILPTDQLRVLNDYLTSMAAPSGGVS